MILTYHELIRRIEAIRDDLAPTCDEIAELNTYIHILNWRKDHVARTTGMIRGEVIREAVEAPHDDRSHDLALRSGPSWPR